MLRAMLCAVVGLAICASGLLGAEAEAKKAKRPRGHEGTVTKVSGDEVTVESKDREGKTHEHTVNTKEVKLMNMEGKPAEASDFKVGDKVTVYVREGKVVGLRAGHGHHKGGKEGGKTGGSKEGGSESK